MLKLPKGLKKKKKKSKKDQELFTEEELEQYKRELKAKQEAAAAKSDAGESDAPSDVENVSSATLTTTVTGLTTTTSTTTNTTTGTSVSSTTAAATGGVPATTGETTESVAHTAGNDSKSEVDEEWAKFKALTSGIDSVLHKTQDELDRIKKESFYQRLPSAAEKKRLEEEEAARREAERLEEERRKAAELEAKRDKLAEAVVVLSESEEEDDVEVDDIFATDYIEKITSGEVQLAVVPDSPVLEIDEGPDPFDTAYAEKVIVGADKAKGNKKLVSLGAAVEVLSGRVDREHALALAKPKRKLRKGIKDLLLSESIDLADVEAEEGPTPEPVRNLLDELAEDVPEPDVPIDLSVSLHLNFIQPKVSEEKSADEDEDEESKEQIDLSEFDTLKTDEDDEFAELAVESLSKKEEVKVITQIVLPQPEILSEVSEGDWAEFEQIPEEDSKVKPKRPPPPRPASGPHTIPGAIYISDDEDDNLGDDPFNTAYADEVIKKTTVLEEDEEFDPRAEEKKTTGLPVKPPPPTAHLLASREKFIDPFDTSAVEEIVKPKSSELFNGTNGLKNSLSDPDFDPRADESTTTATNTATHTQNPTFDSETAQRKSSLHLNIQSKTVGFLVPDQNFLDLTNDSAKVQKPLTPFYAPPSAPVVEQVHDPFDTSYVPVSKPTDIELKNLEKSLLEDKTTLEKSLSDPDFDPRADEISVPQDLLAVQENINIKVLTPATETKEIGNVPEAFDPFDTSSIAANIQPGKAELKLLESELLPTTTPEIKTGVLDTQTDAQELGLGDKVLTPLAPRKQITLPEDIDPFDTSIAENLAPGAVEIKLLENELIEH